MRARHWVLALLALLVLSAGSSACRDVQQFSTKGDRYEGPVVAGSFVRAGIPDMTRLCLTLDTDHLQDQPGAISTSDGRFSATPLRPIPQIWHDPLSTLTFGEGRTKNLLYMASPVPTAGDAGGDVTAVVSLMDSGAVEVRLFRGAPGGSAGDAGSPSAGAPSLFAIFELDRAQGPCTF